MQTIIAWQDFVNRQDVIGGQIQKCPVAAPYEYGQILSLRLVNGKLFVRCPDCYTFWMGSPILSGWERRGKPALFKLPITGVELVYTTNFGLAQFRFTIKGTRYVIHFPGNGKKLPAPEKVRSLR